MIKKVDVVQVAEIKSPRNCGESTNVGGVYVCNMDCKPCPVLWDDNHECSLDRMEKMQEAFANLIRGDGK